MGRLATIRPRPARMVSTIIRNRRWTSHNTKNAPKGKRIATSEAWTRAANGPSRSLQADAERANTTTLMLPRLRSSRTGKETAATANVASRAVRDTGIAQHASPRRTNLPMNQTIAATRAGTRATGVSATASGGAYRYSPSYRLSRYACTVSARYSGSPAATRRAAASYDPKSYAKVRLSTRLRLATTSRMAPRPAATIGSAAVTGRPGRCMVRHDTAV